MGFLWPFTALLGLFTRAFDEALEPFEIDDDWQPRH